MKKSITVCDRCWRYKNMEDMRIKVAGVTFNNDDGESRQEILKGLRKSGRRVVDLDLIYTEFDGEPAVKIREKTTKKIVGWVPKKELSRVMGARIKHPIGFISKYVGEDKEIECLELAKPIYPTNVEYHRMKAMCAKVGVAMPAYDIRAYDAFEKKCL